MSLDFRIEIRMLLDMEQRDDQGSCGVPTLGRSSSGDAKSPSDTEAVSSRPTDLTPLAGSTRQRLKRSGTRADEDSRGAEWGIRSAALDL